jgi:two-component system, OmpR family, response regulator
LIAPRRQARKERPGYLFLRTLAPFAPLREITIRNPNLGFEFISYCFEFRISNFAIYSYEFLGGLCALARYILRIHPKLRVSVMRILLVEDDVKIALFVEKGLRAAGYAVDHAPDGETGLHLALTEPYDAAIVDIMLPKLDGLSLIKQMREKKINTPVIVLSAKDSVDDRVTGLQTGSDDYMTKPFAFSELLARVQALIRRAGGLSEPTQLVVGNLIMNLLSREVVREGRRIELQPIEFSLLEYLLRNAGRVVSKTMIMEHVWDYNFDPQTNVVEARISRLRDKIDRDFSQKLIHTIRGVGYVLRENP